MIQLPAGYRPRNGREPAASWWDARPLGVDRFLPRTTYPAGTEIPGFKVDLQTGIATPTQKALPDENP